MSRRATAAALVVALCSGAACTALLGATDVPNAPNDGGSDATGDVTIPSDVLHPKDAGAPPDAGDACPSGSGSLDPSFAGTGTVTTQFSSGAGSSSVIRTVMVLPTGSILAAGTSGGAIALAEYSSDGGLDPVFGEGGTTTAQIGLADTCFGSVLQDQKIVVVGSTVLPDAGSKTVFAVARFTEGGELDHSFGTGGFVTTDFGGIADTAHGVAIQPSDDKVVVAGASATSSASAVVAVARYTKGGQLDTSFGTGGMATASLTGADYGRAVALQPDGRIVVAGVSGAPGASRAMFFLVGFDSTGRVDASFGAGGYQTTPFRQVDQPWAMTLDGDGGGLVVVGQSGVSENDGGPDAGLSVTYLIARYDSNGTLDNGFGVNGGVVGPVGPLDIASGVAIQRDTKIVAVGSTVTDAGSNLGLVRLLPDGGRDPTFGSKGVVETTILGHDLGFSVAIQADGRIVAGGSAAGLVSPASVFAVSRYCP
jgi:uncharacterized delta-60 repeat protein